MLERWNAEVGVAGRSQRQVEPEPLDVEQYRDAADQAVLIPGAEVPYRRRNVCDRDESDPSRRTGSRA